MTQRGALWILTQWVIAGSLPNEWSSLENLESIFLVSNNMSGTRVKTLLRRQTLGLCFACAVYLMLTVLMCILIVSMRRHTSSQLWLTAASQIHLA